MAGRLHVLNALAVIALCVGGSCATHHSPHSNVATVPVATEAPPILYEPRVVGADARIVAGTGYSLVVPSLWKRIAVSEGLEFAFGSFEGDDAGMTISATTLDPQKPMNELVEAVTKGVLSNGRATPSHRDTIQVAGRDVIVNEFAMRGRGQTMHGLIRAQTSDEGIISVVCHSVASSWETLKAGCDPILATMRVGAAAKATTPAPTRMRWLEGLGFRVAIPDTWSEYAGQRDTTLVVARSGDDAQSMLIVTVIGEQADVQPTEKNRDAVLARHVDELTHSHEQTARVTRTGRNVVDLEFSRDAPEQKGVLINAFYDLGATKLVLTCGGLEPAYSRHADICRVAIRSVRSEPPR